jgi:XTP/dITP diphosphohydrolase
LTERRLLLATGNPGKVREIRRAIAGLAYRGEPLAVVGLPDVLPGLKHAERGRTFEENARSKGLFYSRRWPGPALAEDSGLVIDALLEGRPATARKARFVCVMVLAERGRIVAEFRGQVRGRIAQSPRGESGFGYDPIFYYPPLRRTFAELSPGIKNKVSHRGRALAKLRRFLSAAKNS